MAEAACSRREDLGAAGGADCGDDDEAAFNTPPESLEDIGLELSPRTNAELNEIQATEEYIKKNQEWIARSAESVRELKLTMDKLMDQTSSRKSDLENRTQKIKDMKKEIDEISTEAIEQEEEELKKLIDGEKRTQLANGDQESGGDRGAIQQRIDELQMKMGAYKEHLGIEISTTEGYIEFLFTNIDQHCPDSSFSIKFSIEGEDYKCVSCEPPVSNIDDLFLQLNTHHDLQLFITALRSEFQALVNKEN